MASNKKKQQAGRQASKKAQIPKAADRVKADVDRSNHHVKKAEQRVREDEARSDEHVKRVSGK